MVGTLAFLQTSTDAFFGPAVSTQHATRHVPRPLEASALEDAVAKSAVGTAATAAAAVSKAVSMRELTAPDLDQSFIALDKDRSDLGEVDELGLPLVYNRQLIERYWSKESNALQKRWGEFLRYSVPFLTRVATLLIKGGTDELVANDASLAREAREIMEALGPTYVKLGQVLSVRPDILPQAALDELTVLQDSVKPFPTEEAVALIESELGGPLGAFFAEISETPVAAASLAQVYKATLLNGETVAVKVQRPRILEVVSKDLYVLRRAAEVYQGLVERFAPQQRTDYVALLNEWAVGFYTEFDFLNELQNQATVKALLAEQGVADVYVPEGYPELSTRRVMVTEWVDGVKLSECGPEEITELIAVGQEAFLVQLLQVGVFHSDPHPGNLLKLNPETMGHKGKLALLDFGLVARLGQEDMDAIVSAVIHLANRDYPSLVDDFIGLGILPDDCDRAKVVPLMDKALTPYVKGGGAKKYEAELKKMYGFTAEGDGGSEGAAADLSAAVGGFQAMTTDLLTVLNDVPFSIPPYFALIGRAVVTLEGVALTGNPDYGIITEAYPFVARKLLKEDRPELQKALAEVLYNTGGGGGGGALDSTRLLALVNGALGSVARADGGTFVDLDAMPADAQDPQALVKFLLSPQGAGDGLWRLLEPQLEEAADLVLRQALRRASASAWGLMEAARPRLPLLGTALGPAPQDLPLVLPLPARRHTGGEAAGVGGGAPRVVVTSGEGLVGALCGEGLSREEELFALSAVDLAQQLLGPEAAVLLRGEALADAASDPRAAARRVADALDAALVLQDATRAHTASPPPVPGSGGGGGGAGELLASPALASAAKALAPLLRSVGGAAPAGHSRSSQLAAASDLFEGLEPEEKEKAGAITSRLLQGVVARFEARLSSL